jgi:TRAP-type C4-dicarboxylate transport system substrate-binding protein
MASLDLDQILNTVNNAINAVKTANNLIDQLQESKMVVVSDTTQEQVDAAIEALKKEYDELHERVQNKLRGTAG